MNQKFYRLHNSITSTIYEGIVKIGYEKNTSISIYYDLDLLNYLLDTNFQSPEACLDYLHAYTADLNQTEAFISVHLVKNRFQFTVLSYGIERILSEYEQKPFLKELVALVRNHNFTLDDVKNLFQKYSSNYICQEIQEEEFQYVFSFEDKALDEYVYCFNLNDCYYHRLLPYDYARL